MFDTAVLKPLAPLAKDFRSIILFYRKGQFDVFSNKAAEHLNKTISKVA
jgi:hypothetical protein